MLIAIVIDRLDALDLLQDFDKDILFIRLEES